MGDARWLKVTRGGQRESQNGFGSPPAFSPKFLGLRIVTCNWHPPLLVTRRGMFGPSSGANYSCQ